MTIIVCIFIQITLDFIDGLFKLFIQDIKNMGNSNNNLTETQFKEHWKQIEVINGLTVWENKENPSQRVDQYIVRDDQIENNQKLNQLRKNNPFLVNAQTLKKEGFSCQMDHDAKKLYVQRTPLRLSNLKDIPYPDIFHLYDVCLHGYEHLSKLVGYFSIDEDQIGINEGGQAKVWLSNHFQSNKINGVSVTESKMVSDILTMLYQVADNESCGNYPNLSTYIANHQKITFAQVITKFVSYVRTYCGAEIPTRLSCVNEVGPAKIEYWCKTNQANVIYTQNSQPELPVQARGDVVNKLAPGGTYANRMSSQPVIISNTSPNPTQGSRTNINFQSTGQTFGTISPVIETRVGQTSPPSNLFLSGARHNVVTYPPNNVVSFPQPQKINTIPVLPNPPVSFNSRPVISSNLVGVNYGAQNLNPVTPRANIANSQFRFASSPITYIPQAVQQLPRQNIQRPLTNQNTTYVTQTTIAVRNQVITQSYPQTQTIPKANATPALSQSPIAIYNQPLQVVESMAFTQIRDENRLQQQRVLSQTIELKDGGKTVQTTNLPVLNNQKNLLKGSETIQWEDYTNKQKSNTNELTNFGRAVPYSFDVANDKKTQNTFENKLTPQSDGKSSPQFLALLNQIKSGIGKTNSYTDNYSSYSTLKGEASQGSYGTYEDSNKYASSDYIFTKYGGGMDAELNADLQKYNK